MFRTAFLSTIAVVFLVGLCAAQDDAPVELSFVPHPSGAREEAFSGLTDRLSLESELKQKQQKRLIQRITFGGSWTPEGGDNGLGLTNAQAGLTFALPGPKWKFFEKSFFLFSPGIKYTNAQWKYPTSFPDSLYNAGLTVTWMKPLNERWSLMLNASPSYSGDGKTSGETIRCPVMFGANWTPNSRWKVLMGVAYLDRGDIPVLPIGGFTYTPNDDWKFECMAPQPRIARRLTGWSDSQIDRWLYLGGGFGGDTWAISSTGGRSDLAMYREFSVLLGYESVRKQGTFQWNAEIAYLFDRRMEFEHDTQPTFKPDDSLSLRVRVSF